MLDAKLARRDRADSPTLDIPLCRNSIDAGKRQRSKRHHGARAALAEKRRFGRDAVGRVEFNLGRKTLGTEAGFRHGDGQAPVTYIVSGNDGALAREIDQTFNQSALRGEIDCRGRAGDHPVNGLRILGG